MRGKSLSATTIFYGGNALTLTLSQRERAGVRGKSLSATTIFYGGSALTLTLSLWERGLSQRMKRPWRSVEYIMLSNFDCTPESLGLEYGPESRR